MSEATITINERAGVLKINGPISGEISISFREKLDLLVYYYQHRRLTLQICSEGGQVTGLRHMLDSINAHRAQGVKFATEAPFTACSAAAMLLAYGEPGSRVVSRQALLLFHHARQLIPESQMLTADAALRIARVLSQLDAAFEHEIIEHLERSFGGIAELAEEGIARCQLLLQQGGLITSQLRLGQVEQQPAKVQEVENMWTACSSTNSATPYLAFLRIVFAKDDWMRLTDAYSLLLIDAVELVPAMLPRSSRQIISSPTYCS